MITRHAPLYAGPNYRVLVFHLLGDAVETSLTATLAELKSRGVSVDETVVMDVSNVHVLPSLLSGAIRAKAYDCFVVTGAVAEIEPAAPMLPALTVFSKLMDIAVIRATPLGIGACSASASPEQADKVARRAVLDALETANSIDTVDEL